MLESLAKSGPSHEIDQLFDHRRALSIGNSVNQRLSSVCSRTISLDLVVCGGEIFSQAPSFVTGHVQPGFILELVDKFASLRACFIAERRREGLIKPKVFPPLHSYEISEPHVAKFVLDNHTEEGELGD